MIGIDQARSKSLTTNIRVHAGELAVEPHFQILRRNRRPLLLRVEHAHRSTLENHVHRSPRLGSRRSIIVMVGISGYFVTQDAYLESTISILTVLAWIAATTEAMDLVLERYS